MSLQSFSPLPLAIFQNGSDLSTLSVRLGGPVSIIVDEQYATPQVLPLNIELNLILAASCGTGVQLPYIIRDMSTVDRPHAILCQFGGSEGYFYRSYTAIIGLSSAIWFLVRPQYSCTDQDGMTYLIDTSFLENLY